MAHLNIIHADFVDLLVLTIWFYYSCRISTAYYKLKISMPGNENQSYTGHSIFFAVFLFVLPIFIATLCKGVF